jgi:hypothetical protein
MNNNKLILIMATVFLSLIFSSCVSTTSKAPAAPVVGKGSSLSTAVKNIVLQIKARSDFTQKDIQISANNFWEQETRMNLPFSSILARSLSAEFSKQGANITLQDSANKSLKIVGSYITAGNDVSIIVRLRSMGEAASTDLAVAEGRISKESVDMKWFEPEFERIARSLVNLLELDYSGMLSLKIKVSSFKPGTPSQAEIALGDELSKYMKDAFAASSVFREAGGSLDKADAVLNGDYSKLGQNMVFHVSIADKKTSKHLAGAKISTGMANIPLELLQPKIQSLDDLAEKVSKLILEKSQSELKNKTSIIYIGKNSFHDSKLKAVTLFGRRVSDKFKDILSEKKFLTITDDPSIKAGLILTGHYFNDQHNVFLSTDLSQIKKTSRGLQKTHIASAEGKLDPKFCSRALFKPDFRGYTDYLMKTLENQAAKKLPTLERTNLVIHKFKFENQKHFSKLSDYLNSYFLNYFASSIHFSPVTNTKTQKMVERSFTRGARTIVAAKSSEAAIASVSNADYYISGSFWPRDKGNMDNGSIELKTKLLNVKGEVLASEQVQVSLKNCNIDKKWFEIPDQTTKLLPEASELTIELFTRKGRNNLSYKKGEEIIFFAKANKNVYVRIFTSDALKNIYRIYPNDFEKKDLMLRAGQVTSIPNNSYASDFKFEVQGTTGNEMVFAFASDTPLPDLPGSKDAVFGMQQVNLTTEEIIEFFTNYTRGRGISLSWDSLPILTMD